MTPILVIPVGTPIKIGDDIDAIVAAVMIGDGSHVRYQVTWWDGKTRREEWVAGRECAIAPGRRVSTIGFLREGTT